MNELKAAALSYASYGWAVIPLHGVSSRGCTCGHPHCNSPGKHPRTEHGIRDGSTDREAITDWWRRWPNANIGIVASADSGVLVVDVDRRHDGDHTLDALIERNSPLPDTPTVITGDGTHHYLRHPGAPGLKDKLGSGLDIKANGFVVAPPSMHHSGCRYEWEASSEPSEVPLADVPDWMSNLLFIGKSDNRPDHRRPAAGMFNGVAEGERNSSIFRYGCLLRGRGLANEEAKTLVLTAASRCRPPLSEQEALRCLESAWTYHTDESLNDLGNTRRFVSLFGEDLLYVPEFKRWYTWDTPHWVEDASGEVERRAKEVVPTIQAEARNAEGDKREGLLKHAKGSGQAQRVDAIVKLARTESEVVLPQANLDSDPMLLGVLNGVVGLRTPGSRSAWRGNRRSRNSRILCVARAFAAGNASTPSQKNALSEQRAAGHEESSMVAIPKFSEIDQQETHEWIESLRSVIERDGVERAHYLLESLMDEARTVGANLPYSANTAYLNSIPESREAHTPGDPAIEWRIRSLIRWNALAMVVQANRLSGELGGHIASFASSATLYDVGFNHFWHAPSERHGGDLIFIQGHCAPGIYARAYLEGRLTESQLHEFRQEAAGAGLSSYPHPWLMPDFWQFPTVSMGLGPLMAIYQARFMKYLHNRGLLDTEGRKVWAFMGDGESDEPESMGAITLASREHLDNLIFVINCNLQRLDGPVRGNGKIIQELEAAFRGAGWNVIKVIWGSYWDPLLQRDTKGLLRKRMEEAVDGEYQAFKAKGGAYTREHFFGRYPELKKMVSNLSDDDIWRLNRGGHDPHKVYAAYAEAVKHVGQPTVILAKTVKGYGMGEAGEGQNITHQQKKMGEDALKAFRDRFDIPISDDDIADAPFYRPPSDSPEIAYLLERRKALGGFLPQRRKSAKPQTVPDLSAFEAQLKSSGEREFSTTMAMVRILTALTRNKTIGQYVVPIVPDEARTFGMEGLFRQLGIYAPRGQLYEPVDSDQLMYYREDQSGQVLQEGINEPGAISSWIAAGTAYSNHGINMIPFYLFYSMFGFQRVGDLAWAAGDMQTRGFLVGGTAGRTTLAGEGLQHDDGHSHLLAANIPNCIAYDPTYAYELAVIVQDGMRRMFAEQESIFYYITVMNENYAHPEMPSGVEQDILKGLYLLREGPHGGVKKPAVQLLGSGTILREVEAAAELLEQDFSVCADVWSATSLTELRREGAACERYNLLNPQEPKQVSYVERCLSARPGPVVAATDYNRLFADQIRPFVPRRYVALGTDGYGRSDTRARLRRFFEVDRQFITLAALQALADEGDIDRQLVADAMRKYDIDPSKLDPTRV